VGREESAERSRFEAEQHLRAILAVAPMVLWALDRDRRVTG